MKIDVIDAGRDRQAAGALWRALAARAPHTYFLSPGWVEPWLESLPPEADVELVVGRKEGVPVLGFFLGRATAIRHHLLPSRARFLNASGIPAIDRLRIEYNAVLTDKSVGLLEVKTALTDLPGSWDEVFLSALDAEAYPGRWLAGRPVEGSAAFKIDKELESPYVDLDQVRKQGDYLALLGSGARARIRRSQRGYQIRGPLALDVADNRSAAVEIYDQLVELHRGTWKARGRASAFDLQYFRDFHRQLVERRHAFGEIQLMRLRAGDATVGCLYNFVYRGKVYFYQSGMSYDDDNRLKPGLTCHAAAVEHNARLGHECYDFLAGKDDYKWQLATGSNRLIWGRLQRPRIRFRLENAIRTVKHKVVPIGGRRRPGWNAGNG